MLSDPLEIRVVGRLLGLDPGRERDLEDLYRKTARHARLVAERILFGRARTAGESAAAVATTAPSPPSAARSAMVFIGSGRTQATIALIRAREVKYGTL